MTTPWTHIWRSEIRGSHPPSDEAAEFNLATRPPRLVLGILESQKATIRELGGLLEENSRGVAPLNVVGLGDTGMSDIPAIDRKMAARLKQPGEYNARFRIRGAVRQSRMRAAALTPTRGRLGTPPALSAGGGSFASPL